MATHKRVLEMLNDDEGGAKAAGEQEQGQDQNQQLLCFYYDTELIISVAGTSEGGPAGKR